ncbi:MAG: ABC transporter ATP-binding protein [Candidatus Binatia bacterium]
MGDVAIRIARLGKAYRLGARRGGYTTLRGVVSQAAVASVRALSAPFRRRQMSTSAQMIWALDDLSCEIKCGEVVGVVGRNGAGKSTLLKILSRITEPTVGFAEVHGRMGSLLEVGTGFHPELTGRENIYLNGAILGMGKADIARKFDEIVAFAETEPFLDTPVKHYSSGMYLRLAFAVAAHLEPDILLVDEVLAVGDAAFQKKCLGRMGDVAHEGRTVLFVSHNMGAITQLCSRALWLQSGQLKLSGSSADVVASYLSSTASNAVSDGQLQSVSPSGQKIPVRLCAVQVLADTGQPTCVVRFDQPFRVQITYDVQALTRSLSIVCRLTDILGNVVWTSWDTDTTDWSTRAREPGRYTSTCTVPNSLIRPGTYSLSVGVTNNRNSFDLYEQVLAFEVSQVGYPLNPERIGIVTPLLDWVVQPMEEYRRPPVIKTDHSRSATAMFTTKTTKDLGL